MGEELIGERGQVVRLEDRILGVGGDLGSLKNVLVVAHALHAQTA
jgi:hypothetical protein